MDYHKILNLSPGASLEEIKKAHRKLVAVHHPDKGGDVNKFKQIQAAYEFLIKAPIKNNKNQPQTQAPKSGNFKIYEAPPPKYDLWGNKLSSEDQQEWVFNNVSPMKKVVAKPKKTSDFIDIFANNYEDSEVPDIR